jgi:hypothetical protein
MSERFIVLRKGCGNFSCPIFKQTKNQKLKRSSKKYFRGISASHLVIIGTSNTTPKKGLFFWGGGDVFLGLNCEFFILAVKSILVKKEV